MKIPDKIQIAGKEWIIKFDNVQCDRENSYGLCNFHKGEITLQNIVNGIDKRKQDFIDEAFIHEIIHAIYNVVGKTQDENFICELSELLYQVIKQIEGKNNV